MLFLKDGILFKINSGQPKSRYLSASHFGVYLIGGRHFQSCVQCNNARYIHWFNSHLIYSWINPQSNHHAGNNSWGPWNDRCHDKTLSRFEEADKRQWMDTHIVRYWTTPIRNMYIVKIDLRSACDLTVVIVSLLFVLRHQSLKKDGRFIDLNYDSNYFEWMVFF